MAAKIALLLLLTVVGSCWSKKLEAVAEITSGHPSVRGIVTFKEKKDGWVEVKGKMYGLSPGGHGIHIHNSGDVSDSCAHIGDHFDPYNEPHGVHVGDLINVFANESGEAKFKVMKRNIRLDGPYSVIGRSLGIDLEEDIYHDHQQHATVACGVITLKYKNKDYKKGHKKHHHHHHD